MSVVNEIILITGMMVVTFSIRYILLAFSSRFSLPGVVEKALKYVPPAVLTAIIVPAVLLPDGRWDLSLSNAYLTAGVIAVIAGFLFPKKVFLAAISSGLVVFALVRFFKHYMVLH